jgi:hypothetical protein
VYLLLEFYFFREGEVIVLVLVLRGSAFEVHSKYNEELTIIITLFSELPNIIFINHPH